MSDQTELQVVGQQPLAVARQMPTALDMIQKVIDGGVTSENVAALRELVALKRDMDADNAAKEFAAAFVRLQRELPKVQATKIIPDKHGNMRSSFAPFEEIDKQVRPMCLAEGFTYSFTEGDFQQGRITKICVLQHVGGHQRTNPYTVRIGNGPPGCSESQADGSAHSYAKRGALCDALNIIVHGIDNDARLEGGTINPGQAFDLRQRVRACGADEKAFLTLAAGPGKDYEDICEAKYDMLDALLSKKERLAEAKTKP